jgi:hypothetical protein
MTTRRFARKRWSAKAFSERVVQTGLCESTQTPLYLVLILLAPAHRTRVGEHLRQCSSSQSGSWDLCSSRHSADWKHFFRRRHFTLNVRASTGMRVEEIPDSGPVMVYSGFPFAIESQRVCRKILISEKTSNSSFSEIV